jgi:hypothetical protein
MSTPSIPKDLKKAKRWKADKRPRWHKVHCDYCEVLVINGVVCHEFGCPNGKHQKKLQ